MIKIENLKKSYKGEVVFQNLNLRVEKGEKIAIVGKSGVGKSTLAKIIVGMEKADEGAVKYTHPKENAEPSPFFAQYISQQPFSTLDPTYSLERSVLEPISYFKIKSGREKKAFARELMRTVGLCDELFSRKPFAISGGEAQRAVIARALAFSPELIISDESTAMLDVVSQKKIMQLIDDYCKKNGTTLILITHDLALAKKMTERIYLLENETLSELSK